MTKPKKRVAKKGKVICENCGNEYYPEEMDGEMCIYCTFDIEDLLEDKPIRLKKVRRYE